MSSSVSRESLTKFHADFEEHLSQVRQNKAQVEGLISRVKRQEKIPQNLASLKKSTVELEAKVALLEKDVVTLKKYGSIDAVFDLYYKTFKKDPFLELDSLKRELSAAKENINISKAFFEAKEEDLFDAKETNPKRFEEVGFTFLKEGDKRAAYRYLEKAADLYIQQKEFKQGFALRARIAKELSPEAKDRLYQLDDKIDEFHTVHGYPQARGAKFSTLDAGKVKRGMISARKRSYEGEKEKIQVNYKLSRPAREEVEKTLLAIQKDPKGFAKTLPPNLQGKVTFQLVPNGFHGPKPGTNVYSRDLRHGQQIGKAWEVTFKGVGSILIGAESHADSMYTRVVAQVDANQPQGVAIGQLHAMTAMLGLGGIVQEASQAEDERKQIALLFRMHYPKEAFVLERKETFYEISPAELKQIIIRSVPEMTKIFDEYFETGKMVKEEIHPGCTIWTMSDLGDKMKKEGAIGLMAGFSGTVQNLARLVTQGSSATMERLEDGKVQTIGTSSLQDITHGGAGSVFTRVITKKMVETRLERPRFDDDEPIVMESAAKVSRFPWYGSYQLIYDISAVNGGGYAYSRDRYGTKGRSHYSKRDNFIDFTRSLDENSVSNELMIKNEISPKKLKAILVSSNFSKKNLIQQLRDAKLTEMKGDKEYMKGYDEKSLEKLIITGKYFTEDMWR